MNQKKTLIKRFVPLLILLLIAGGGVSLSLFILNKNGASSGCLEIDKADFLIAGPGKYCLTGDIKIGDNTGIAIKAQDVELDLGGHCIKGNAEPMTRGIGIDIQAGSSNIGIANGCISGTWYGIRSADGAEKIDVSDLRLQANRFRGAYLVGDHISVRRLQVSDTGGSRVYDDAYSMGIEVRAKNCLIADNTVTDTYPTDCGEGIGIAQSSDKVIHCEISNNRIANSRFPNSGRTFGIWADNDTLVRSNTIEMVTYSMNIGNSALVKGNTLIDEACGMQYYSTTFDHALNTDVSRSKLQCPDDLQFARRHFSPRNRCSSYRLAQINHMRKNYREAAKYYFVAGGKEASRQPEIFRELGFVTDSDVAWAKSEAEKILAGSRRGH